MRTIKVTKDSQATSQPPSYKKDSGKTKASNLNSCGVCQEHYTLQQAKNEGLQDCYLMESKPRNMYCCVPKNFTGTKCKTSG